MINKTETPTRSRDWISQASLVTGLLLPLAVGAPGARAFNYTDFTIAGANDTILTSINDNGRVAGIYADSINPAQGLTPGWNGFVADIDGTNVTTLAPHPEAMGVEAAAVNNSGVVVGTFSMLVDNLETFRGYVFDGADYTLLDAPFVDANDTIVSSINDQGVIYGSWSQDFVIGLETSSGFRATPDGNGGYQWEDVAVNDPTAFISNTFLSAANSSGQEILTLRRQYFDLFEGFTDDVFSQLTPGDHRIEAPGVGVSRATAINESGLIVGIVTTAEEVGPNQFEVQNRGFTVLASDLQTLPAAQVVYSDPEIPGSENRVASDELGNLGSTGHAGLNGVNNSGVIVGYYDNQDGVYRGFIGMPEAGGMPGDYNGDGRVDASDYTVWRDTLDSTEDLRADGDGDGRITPADFEFWRERFQPAAATQAATPEPNAFALIAVFGCGVAGRRRRV